MVRGRATGHKNICATEPKFNMGMYEAMQLSLTSKDCFSSSIQGDPSPMLRSYKMHSSGRQHEKLKDYLFFGSLRSVFFSFLMSLAYLYAYRVFLVSFRKEFLLATRRWTGWNGYPLHTRTAAIQPTQGKGSPLPSSVWLNYHSYKCTPHDGW